MSIGFSADYFGLLSGTHFCAHQAARLIGTLARNRVLIPAGLSLYTLGCESRENGGVYLRSRKVRERITCKHVIDVTPNEDFLEIVSRRIPGLSMYGADGRDRWLPLAAADGIRLGWHLDPGGKVYSFTLNINGHVRRYSDGVEFASTCTDFPTYLVLNSDDSVDMDWESERPDMSCSRVVGRERLIRVDVSHVSEGFRIQVADCSVPSDLRLQMIGPHPDTM